MFSTLLIYNSGQICSVAKHGVLVYRKTEAVYKMAN